ncbi:hypothetical protein [Agromyces laixinhei]|uniref:hypothetical protein n=1 Tax=Agromyces laixinhei TaxID=2585717 RepID=UPI001116B4B8|nr:hypothetical protein [Agromyces laixinhei]
MTAEPQEQPLRASPAEVRRVRSRSQMVAALVMLVLGLVALVISIVMYDALVELSSTYRGRRGGLRDAVAPGAVLLSAGAALGGLVWLLAWSYRWERVATGTVLKQQASSYLALPSHEASAVLARLASGDPRTYLPLPVTNKGDVVFGVWLAKADRVAYAGVAGRLGRDWQALPLAMLDGPAYEAISRLNVDHYGARASQTIVNGFVSGLFSD